MPPHQAVAVEPADDLDAASDRDASGSSLIQGILFWGILALGFAVPLTGWIWGVTD